MFITTALAAIGCTSQGTSNEPVAPGTTAPIVSTAAEPPVPHEPPPPAPVEAPPPSAPRVFAELERLIPPRTIADRLPADEKEELAQINERFADAYERLRHAYESAPIACSPDDPKCEPTWNAVVEDLRIIREDTENPHCGLGGSAGKLERFAAHQNFLIGQANAIEAELAAAAKRWRAEGKWAAWAQVISPPQPCLRCAMPTQRVVSATQGHSVPQTFGFAEGASDKPSRNDLLWLKKTLDDEPDLKIVLRGHADPAEKDPDALGLARAKAVQASLVELGVSAKRIKVKSFGADLPIGPLATPEGQALNRRVDIDRQNY